MPSECVKILLTGPPGCGKTTAAKKIATELESDKVIGFYTEEIREGGKRKGFRWRRLDGAAGILAHVDIGSRFKVGKYGVDVDGFEKDVVPILDVSRSDAELFVIDEIGKMECFSNRLVAAVRKLFASDRSVLATVAQKGSGLISEVKEYFDTEMIALTRDNRDEIVVDLRRWLSRPSG